MRPFAGMLLLASFFNLLTVVFSIGSVGALIPILNLIFDTPGTDLTGAAQWKVSSSRGDTGLEGKSGRFVYPANRGNHHLRNLRC